LHSVLSSRKRSRCGLCSAAKGGATAREITQLLEAWRQGDAGAGDQVFALMYADLRGVARRQLAALKAGETLAPTILVHEAYMKFMERSAPAVVDRGHFLAIAARAMRHVVVDDVRRRRAHKRDGGAPVPLDSGLGGVDQSPIDVIAVDQALMQLERLDARQATIVDMRFFGGFELEDIAAVLGVSARTVKRDWQKARAFLHAVLR
jgi:RNA polymerase sigma factor (TIGR02999 family)